jgi:hypothetical protein
MPDPFDAYADQTLIFLGPYGCALNCFRSPNRPMPAGPGAQATELGAIRMSLEHLKVVAYLLAKQIDATEKQRGIMTPVTYSTLNNSGISPEDWDNFWAKQA